MAKPGMNLQDSFLNQVRKDNAEVKLSLVEGTMLRGVLRGFDNFTLMLNSGGQQHLIYKHAIAQIVAKRVPRRDDKQPAEQKTAAAEEPAASAEEPFNAMNFSGAREQPVTPESETAPAASPSAKD
jgi:host factor-I protein